MRIQYFDSVEALIDSLQNADFTQIEGLGNPKVSYGAQFAGELTASVAVDEDGDGVLTFEDAEWVIKDFVTGNGTPWPEDLEVSSNLLGLKLKCKGRYTFHYVGVVMSEKDLMIVYADDEGVKPRLINH